MRLQSENTIRTLEPNDSIRLSNPSQLRMTDASSQNERILTIEPDAFMKNYYVNGSRFYVYPMGNRFIWARNFSESVSAEYAHADQIKNAFFILR